MNLRLFFTYILILSLSCHSHQADSTLQNIQFDLADPIQSFMFQELLDSTYYPGSVLDIPAVLDFYGQPLSVEDQMNTESFWFHGRSIIGLRKLRYEDYEIVIYITQDRTEILSKIIVNQSRPSMQLVSIGDPIGILMEAWGDRYHQDGGEDLIYAIGHSELIVFVRDGNIRGFLFQVNDF
jgi:hypothetical protein